MIGKTYLLRDLKHEQCYLTQEFGKIRDIMKEQKQTILANNRSKIQILRAFYATVRKEYWLHLYGKKVAQESAANLLELRLEHVSASRSVNHVEPAQTSVELGIMSSSDAEYQNKDNSESSAAVT
eukprot:UN31971